MVRTTFATDGGCSRRLLGTFLLVLVASLSSCVVGRQDTNEPINAQAVARLEPGTSTARDVVELLGAPNEVVQLGRRTAYRYDATTAKTTGLFLIVFSMFGQDTREDRVWVFFDTEDVLTHVGSTFGTHRTQYALPWEDVHEDEDNRARDAERAGVGNQ